MDVKKIFLLLGALLLAGVSAFMAKNMFGSAGTQPVAAAGPQPVVIDGPEILVATKALPVGTIIDPGTFRYQPWPKELMQDAYYIKGEADPASLAGTVVRNPVTAGQPLTQGALVAMDTRGIRRTEGGIVAARVWRVHGQPLSSRECRAVHQEPADASPARGLQGRVHRTVE